MATSINNLIQQIESADENPQGVVDWAGYLKPALIDMAQSLGVRGIMYFTSTSQLSQAGGGDSGYAIAPDANGILVLYKFFPNVDNTIVGAVTSVVAGQWRPVSAANTLITRSFSISLPILPSFTGVIVTLPTPMPTAVYNVLVQPTNIYAASIQSTIGFFIDNLTTTTFQLRFVSGIVTGGTFNATIFITD